MKIECNINTIKKATIVTICYVAGGLVYALTFLYSDTDDEEG